MINNYQKSLERRIRKREITISDVTYWFNELRNNGYNDKETLKITLKNMKKLNEKQLKYLIGLLANKYSNVNKIAVIDEDILKIEEMIRILAAHRD
jgi:esterase/lipase